MGRKKLGCLKPGKRLKAIASLPLLNRFIKFCKPNDTEFGRPDCWVWIGYCDGNGYGQFRFNGQMIGAHRASYAIFVGTIPDGYEIDHRHSCLKNCVNPNHLFKKQASLHHSESAKEMHRKRKESKVVEVDCPF